jgi:hypothetical protein
MRRVVFLLLVPIIPQVSYAQGIRCYGNACAVLQIEQQEIMAFKCGVNCTPSRDQLLKTDKPLKTFTNEELVFQQQQYKQFLKLDTLLLREALKSDNPLLKLPALFAAGDRKLPMQKEAIKMLTDENPYIQQGARRLLYMTTKLDFGPLPNGDAAASQRMWETYRRRRRRMARCSTPFRPSKNKLTFFGSYYRVRISLPLSIWPRRDDFAVFINRNGITTSHLFHPFSEFK